MMCDNKKIHNEVLSMRPIGYWPCDEGEGNVLRDLSESGNDGSLYNVPWENGLLNFSGLFQWGVIPNHKSYQKGAFSIGGWIFIRNSVIGGCWPGQAGTTFIGNAYSESGYTIDDLYKEPLMFNKSKWRVEEGKENGISICIRKNDIVDIISNKVDAVGSFSNRLNITVGKWHHILYTYEAGMPVNGGEIWLNMLENKTFTNAGVGKLYLDGSLVCSKKVTFTMRDKPFLLGSDAVWWLQSEISGSLNGSMCHLVMFDCAILHHEALNLYNITHPLKEPKEYKQAFSEDTAKINFSSLKEILTNNNADKHTKAKAVLAYIEGDEDISNAASLFRDELNKFIGRAESYVIKIEDTYRNALIKALLTISHDDIYIKEVLKEAFTKPIKQACSSEKYFFSQGNKSWDERGGGNERAYTPVFTHDNEKYIIGDGTPFASTEHLEPDEAKELISKIAENVPQAASWRNNNYSDLYRVRIRKIDSSGQEESILLEGENFIFDGSDQKMQGWSIAVDKDGYIHITGGLHNVAVYNNYVPGAWESIGATQDFSSDNYPTMMYWVSSKPRDIKTLEFVGQRGNPKNIPSPTGINYMNFALDRNNTLYVYGRIIVQGIQSWGLYVYDCKTKRWNAIGGFPADIKKGYPIVAKELIKMASDLVTLETMRYKNTHTRNTVLAWSVQPHFYNFMRGWGIKFDVTNRMHIQVPLFGLDEDNRNVNMPLYAYSDDGGKSFFRADGTHVPLPLSVNPGENNACMYNNDAILWWKLWTDLIIKAGFHDKFEEI